MWVTGKTIFLNIKTHQTGAIGAHPQYTGAVFIERSDGISAQTVWICRFVRVVGESVICSIKQGNTTLCTYPDITVPALSQGPDLIITQTLWIARLGSISGKGIGPGIVAVKPITKVPIQIMPSPPSSSALAWL